MSRWAVSGREQLPGLALLKGFLFFFFFFASANGVPFPFSLSPFPFSPFPCILGQVA